MHMKTTLASSAVILALAISGCSTQEETTSLAAPETMAAVVSAEVEQKATFTAQRGTTLTARVDAINHQTREVTLTDPDGNQVNFIASEEVRNLNQVKTGDTVNINYEQAINVQLVAADGIKPEAAGIAAAGRAVEGNMPGMKAISESVIVATVEAIDLEANTFKLKNTQGEVHEYIARHPENLKKAAVGDAVVITIIEAIAMSVNHASMPAGE